MVGSLCGVWTRETTTAKKELEEDTFIGRTSVVVMHLFLYCIYHFTIIIMLHCVQLYVCDKMSCVFSESVNTEGVWLV